MYKTKNSNTKNTNTKNSNTKNTKKNNSNTHKCPKNYKLCGKNTNNLQLCIKKQENCNSLDVFGSIFHKHPINPEAIRKGYSINYLHNNCYMKEGFTDAKTMELNFTMSTPMKNEFSVATYNLWGIDRNQAQKYLIKKRMPLIIKQILDHDIDIICFQEMSYTTFHILNMKLKNYKLYETRHKIENIKKDRYHDVECAVAIKKQYIPKKIIIEPIGGNLTYTNSLMIIYFENVTLFNCYLQAGTKYSLGQEHLYLHYSRCRLQLLEYIINKIDKDMPSIILGDFNIDLNNNKTNFPELRTIHKIEKILHFVDNWKAIHKKDKGYTENTDTNIMRWNDKFITKKTRVDAIFSRGLTIKDCMLLGNKEEDCIGITKSEEKMYIENFTPNKPEYSHKLKKVLLNNKMVLPLFGSDHYGVLSKFLSFTKT